MKENKVARFLLRLTDRQRHAIEKVAKKNNRSINKEIQTAVENHVKVNTDGSR